mgnify:CR=1 FL=1
MITPRTLLDDYLEYRSREDAIAREWFQNIGTSTSARMEALQKEYEGRVFPEDVHYFGDADSLVEFLESNGFGDVSRETIDHERSHLEKAVELGYNGLFGVRVLVTKDGKKGYAPFVYIEGEIDRAHYVLIALAPESKSDSDYRKIL